MLLTSQNTRLGAAITSKNLLTNYLLDLTYLLFLFTRSLVR